MKRIAAVVLLGSLSSCSLFSNAFNQPVAEDPVDEGETYLSIGDGPQSDVELGPGQKTLMEEYVAVQGARIELDQKVKELEAQLETVRSTLERTEQERNQERTLGAGAQAELDRLRTTLQDRESKILNLTLEKARLEQEVLKLRIASLQGQLERMGGEPQQAAMPGGHR